MTEVYSWATQGIPRADFPHLEGWFDARSGRSGVIRSGDVLSGRRRRSTPSRRRTRGRAGGRSPRGTEPPR